MDASKKVPPHPETGCPRKWMHKKCASAPKNGSPEKSIMTSASAGVLMEGWPGLLFTNMYVCITNIFLSKKGLREIIIFLVN